MRDRRLFGRLQLLVHHGKAVEASVVGAGRQETRESLLLRVATRCLRVVHRRIGSLVVHDAVELGERVSRQFLLHQDSIFLIVAVLQTLVLLELPAFGLGN